METKSIVGIHPIGENVLQVAAFFCLKKKLKAVKVADKVIYPYFTWKQYHFFEFSRDPHLEKRLKMLVRPNNAYHILLHGMKHKTMIH